MTDREPWPLLAALDELLARGLRQEDERAVDNMEVRIYHETGISALGSAYRIPHLWLNADRSAVAAEMWPRPPFLRSRDAAAMLEEAVIAKIAPAIVIGVGRAGGSVSYHQLNHWDDGPVVAVRNACEAAARTRAALEAGWKVGLWPVRDQSDARQTDPPPSRRLGEAD